MEHEKRTPEEVSAEEQRKAAAQKKFVQAFDIKDDVGFSQLQHGYMYLKYINLYIYKMRASLGRFLPGGPDAVRPQGDVDEAVEQMLDMQVAHTNAVGRKMSTNGYHAKVMRYEDAQKIFHLKDDLNLTNLPKTIIPYDKARRALIENPGRILLLECACRNARGEKGCYPREVCMLLGEPWVSWGIEHMQDSHPRIITQEEALEIIRKQHEAGNVQNAFFKDACGDRLYGFCNCCTCCCVAMAGQNYAGAPAFASSGYVRVTDLNKCKGCGTCAEYCHFLACKVVDGKVTVDASKCKGCGICVSKCPEHGNTLVLDDPEVSAPLDLDVLLPGTGE